MNLLEDQKLNEDLKKYPLILDDFQIPTKFHKEVPWPFAQAELKKMASYEAPHDKYLCISRAWEIISNTVSMVDDPGPDACWPIMAFVVHVSELDNAFSNIQ